MDSPSGLLINVTFVFVLLLFAMRRKLSLHCPDAELFPVLWTIHEFPQKCILRKLVDFAALLAFKPNFVVDHGVRLFFKFVYTALVVSDGACYVVFNFGHPQLHKACSILLYNILALHRHV